MSKHQHLELRVLSGMQAGAHLPLAPGTYWVGSDGGVSDIVLGGGGISNRHFEINILDSTDAGQRNKIKVQSERGVFLGSREIGSGVEKSWPKRVPLLIGQDVLLIMDDPEAPWPTFSKIQSVLRKMGQALSASNGKQDTTSLETGNIPEQDLLSVPSSDMVRETDHVTIGDEQNKTVPILSEEQVVLSQEKSDGLPPAVNVSEENTEERTEKTETTDVTNPYRMVTTQNSLTSHQWWPVWLAMGLMMLVGVMVILLLAGVFSDDDQTKIGSISKTQERSSVSHQEIQGIQDALRQALPNHHLRVYVAAGSQLTISGHVAVRPELEALKEVLRNYPRNIKLKIWVDEELKALAQSIIQEDWTSIHVERVEQGVLTLTGSVQRREDIQRILEILKGSVEGIVRINDDVLTADDAHRVLKSRLEKAGLLEKIKFEVRANDIRLTGDLNRDDHRRFETLFRKFIQEFGKVLTVQANIKTNALPLPFGIQAAIGGDVPFVVTDKGEKVWVGGYIQGYRLMSVDDQRIVFSGPEDVIVER